MKSMDYIFGGEKSPTPEGIFMIEKKSPEEYISGYYPERKNVKFFGYIRRDVFAYHNRAGLVSWEYWAWNDSDYVVEWGFKKSLNSVQ